MTFEVAMKKLGLLLAAAAFGGAAAAADMAVKAPPATVAPDYSWTGFYVGANGGYGWGNGGTSYSPNDLASALLFGGPFAFANSAPATASYTNSGGFGGFQLGYNRQFARSWLAGIEADFDWSSVGASSTIAASPLAAFPLTTSATEKVDWFGTVRARLGYLPMDDLLLFVTGGYAYARVEQGASLTNSSPLDFSSGFRSPTAFFNCDPSSVCFSGSSSNLSSGWAAGAGFEFAVFKNVAIKAEYLYLGLNNGSVVIEASPANAAFVQATQRPSTISATFNSFGMNIVRAGLNYRF